MVSDYRRLQIPVTPESSRIRENKLFDSESILKYSEVSSKTENLLRKPNITKQKHVYLHQTMSQTD